MQLAIIGNRSDHMGEELISLIVDRVIEALAKENSLEKLIPIEASARHVHLSKMDVERLFGEGYRLTPERELSQPGEFLCKERVTVIGPKGILRNTAVLGPERTKTQIELSRTDALAIGVEAPLRISGDIEHTPSILLSSGNRIIETMQGVIIAKRHIHMPIDIANRYGVVDGQIVKVKVFSQRPIIFEDVLIRANKNYQLSMHIDFDEANACCFTQGIKGEILLEER